MSAKREDMLRKLLRGRPRFAVADIREFVAYYSKTSDSAFIADCKRVLAMTSPAKKSSLVPPAGLKAKQAVPIMLAYVNETREPVDLTSDEKKSFSSVVEALDRRFGAGFTQRVIDELNALPNGAHSLRYDR